MSFKVILADPAWKFDNRGNRFSPDYAGAYKTTKNDQIIDMGADVRSVAADDALLFLWCPNALILEGVGSACCLSWGFEPKQLSPWLKTCADGETPRIGGGNYTRACTEQMILATRGRAAPLVKDRGVPGVIESIEDLAIEPIRAPRSAHSAKPDEAYRLIERLVDGPYLELFARRRWSEQWTVLGDEAPGAGAGRIA